MPPTTLPFDSAYAEAQPPPPPVVKLVSDTDLHPPKFRTLTTEEDLPDKFEPPAKTLAFASTTSTTKAKPVPSAPASSSRQSAPPPSLALPANAGTTAANGGSSSDGDGVTPKIACPKGLTRKTLTNHEEFVHSGDTTRDEEIANLTAYVQKLAKKHLNLSAALSFQGKDALQRVYHEMKDKFPNLGRYAKDWPTKCLLQAHLKVTSDAAKTAVITNFKKEVSPHSVALDLKRVELESLGRHKLASHTPTPFCSRQLLVRCFTPASVIGTPWPMLNVIRAASPGSLVLRPSALSSLDRRFAIDSSRIARLYGPPHTITLCQLIVLHPQVEKKRRSYPEQHKESPTRRIL
ncbi:hypothetical protein C8F04DRAFT_1175866 [Mycena alexandri]|uniref:Uncharacterized protein n=1 Tax=Mycena alexandri TaxID=1745969 RepID=A0AAD6TEB5_9AGAR|nr:hypothetical protein C8F04DRAFT_1175866 [Mycena alexandri]